MKSRKKELAIAGGSFIAGIAVGVVSSEFLKQFCRESINTGRVDAIRELKDQQKEFMVQVNQRLSDFRKRVRKELHEPIPDLYKATEGLTLDEQDIELEH
jgi:hypothetical protein